MLHRMSEMPSLNPDNKIFLENFPQSVRSTISNLFLEPIRSRITDPVFVLRFVFKASKDRAESRYADADRIQRETDLQSMLRAKYTDALALAEYYIAYESLPPSEKQRIKSASVGAYLIDAMQEKPVTEKQRELLIKLGWAGNMPLDRKAASLEIDRLLNGQENGQKARISEIVR